jgi:hypothetical protein
VRPRREWTESKGANVSHRRIVQAVPGTRRVVRVVPSEGGYWGVEINGRLSSSHREREQAIETGRSYARNAELGQLVIHRRDGLFEREHVYRRDSIAMER